MTTVSMNNDVNMLPVLNRLLPCFMALLLTRFMTTDSTVRIKLPSENEYDVGQHVDSWTSSDIVGRYARYDEIVSWQNELSLKYPDIVKSFDIGKTHEGRSMKLLKLGTHVSKNSTSSKWSIWLDGGIHAREHITPSSIVYIADQLLQSYLSGSGETRWLLEHVDWYLLPVLNPDGYEFSHTKEGRMWRKNRRPVNQNCTGVDLNRNWNIAWGGADSDRDPCSDQYMGQQPETEPEVINVVKFLLPRAEQFIAFVTFHSYGQRIMTRWDHTTTDLPDDHPQLMYLANKMALAMQQPYGTEYDSGIASQLSYAFGGGSADWARAVANIRYSYLIELRDRDGFQLPVDQVIPTGRESWEAVRELAAHILFNDGFTRPRRDQLRHHYRRREPEIKLPCLAVDGEGPSSLAVHETLVDNTVMTSSNNSCHRRTFIFGDMSVLLVGLIICCCAY